MNPQRWHNLLIAKRSTRIQADKVGIRPSFIHSTHLYARGDAQSIKLDYEIRQTLQHINTGNITRFKGKICQECGSSEQLEASHIIPSYLGGCDKNDNTETKCRRCHRITHARREGQRLESRKYKTPTFEELGPGATFQFLAWAGLLYDEGIEQDRNTGEIQVSPEARKKITQSMIDKWSQAGGKYFVRSEAETTGHFVCVDCKDIVDHVDFAGYCDKCIKEYEGE